MDAQVLKIVGAVAGIGGIALALFFWLFRDIVRKNIFPRLTKEQAYKTIQLLMVLATVVALAGIASWAFAGPREGAAAGAKGRVMTVQLTSVGYETLAPAQVLDGADIAGGGGGSISDAALDKAADQVAAWMTERGELSPHESVTVTVTPSGHPTKPPAIEVTPKVEWTAYSVVKGSGGKDIRELASSSASGGGNSDWKAPEGAWDLQVDLSGHRTIRVASDITAPTTQTSARIGVSLAFDDRAGSLELVAPRLTQRFQSDPRFRLVSPESLAEARRLVRENPGMLTPTPDSTAQITLRERFGFDYIVACSVRVK